MTHGIDTTSTRGGEQLPPTRRRGAPVSTRWAEVVHVKWGLLQVSKVFVKPEVTYEELEAANRDEQMQSVDTYFSTPLGIFASERVVRRSWVSRVFDFIHLWPQPLEQRLIEHDAVRFGSTDEDIRDAIDTAMDVFEHNVFQYMILKRFLQLVAIVSILAPTLFVLVALPPDNANPDRPALAAGAAVIWIAIVFWAYIGANDALHAHVYKHVIKYTADHVSQPIKDRLMSIQNCMEKYVNHVDRLVEGGESMPQAARVQDPELSSGHAFHGAQMLMWLPVRTLGIEWAIRNRMEAAEKKHAIYASIGFLIALAILTLFLVIGGLEVASLFRAIVRSFTDAFPEGAPLAASLKNATFESTYVAQLVLLLVGLAAGIYVSYLSYYKAAWNPQKHLLHEYFNTSDWATFSKLQMNVRLSARVQRAMAAIDKLNQQIGSHRP